MSDYPAISPFDLPPPYLQRRWPGLAAAEDNPLARLEIWRGRRRRRIPGLWFLQGAGIGAAAVWLIHTDFVWLSPVALIVYFMLAGSLSRRRTLIALFGNPDPDFLQGLYLAPIWMHEIILGRLAGALSRRRMAMWLTAAAVLALYYVWLGWRVRSPHLALTSVGLLAASVLVWLQGADLFVLQWHYLRVRAIWYNQRSGFGKRLSHLFDVGCLGCMLTLMGGMAVLIVVVVSMSSLAIMDPAAISEVSIRALPLLILLLGLILWYVSNISRRVELMHYCQGFYYNLLTIEATGEYPEFNPYVHWLGRMK